MFNLPAYLARLNYTGPTEPTLETLVTIHRQHLLTVPFENLDIHLGRKIILDEDHLFNKIVNQRRGGYCYELNGLFAVALRQLGFTVTLLSAGVWNSEQSRFGPQADHLCLLIQLNEPWLADVGFGDCALEPLRLNDRNEQLRGPQRVYRLEPESDNGYIMHERRDAGEWAKGYRFSLQPMRLYDFTYGNHYMQTSPDTHFTQKRICTRATPNGRLTLSDFKFIQTIAGQRTERLLANETEWHSVLKEHFDIVL
jgi:N-hydroxyarylamine O-acetyltransferase